MTETRCKKCQGPVMLLAGEKPRRYCVRCRNTFVAQRELAEEGVLAMEDLPTPASPHRDQRPDCAKCGERVGHSNVTGYCFKCQLTAFVCSAPGCDKRVSASSRSGRCGLHRKVERVMR